LPLAVGQHHVPIEWKAPYAGDSELEIDVQTTGGARVVHSEPPPCGDRVEIDVDVKLHTPDGAPTNRFLRNGHGEAIELPSHRSCLR
jgi:hypothetical protein